MKTAQSQSGFALVEAILVVVILGAVGFVGYYVYHTNNQATDIYDAANNSSSAPINRSKADAPSTSASDISAAAAAADPNSSQTTQDISDADSALSNY